MRKLKFVDLFAGLGGFHVGLSKLGHKCIYACEIDKQLNEYYGKNFTLDKKLPGPDHAASLEPDELIAMVKAIKNIEAAISGSGTKEPSESEMKNIAIVRKSIHLVKSMKTGEVINESDIVALRPGLGISPMQWENVIGKTLVNDKNAYDLIHWEDLK